MPLLPVLYTSFSEKIGKTENRNKLFKKEKKMCLTRKTNCGNIIKHCFGELPEWFKGLVLKTSDSERDRGFESHLLRSVLPEGNNFIFFYYFGEVPKLAEGAPLERE